MHQFDGIHRLKSIQSFTQCTSRKKEKIDGGYQKAQIDDIVLLDPAGRSYETEIPKGSLLQRTGRWWLVCAIGDALRRAAEDLDRVFQAALNVDLRHVRKEQDAFVESRFEQRIT